MSEQPEVTINLTYELGKGWVANVIQMPGCIIQGDDLMEVLNMIGDAIYGWADISVQDGSTDPLVLLIDAEAESLENETFSTWATKKWN